MPFKSRAQRRKFAELLVKGEITPETFEEWNRETGSAKLPEHVRKPAKRRKKKAASKHDSQSSPLRPPQNEKRKPAVESSFGCCTPAASAFCADAPFESLVLLLDPQVAA